jgi:hypothetical protein
MSNRRQPSPTVEVVEPIKVRTIEWRRSARHRPPVAIGVNLTYHFRDRSSKFKVAGQTVVADVRGGPFGIEQTLALANHLPDDLLVRFLALWERANVAKALRELGGDPKQSPVVLRSGLLAGLLQFGITPDEPWTFLLNHGAARRKSMALLNLSGTPEVRTFDPWVDATEKYELLDKATAHCSEAAKLLRRLESVDMSTALVEHGYARSFDLGATENPQLGPIIAGGVARIGPLPALPPELTKRTIVELQHIAANLKEYLPIFKQPRRVANPDMPRFCRDWYDLATERAKNPLYAYGAALYSLLFRKPSDPRVTEASFTELCRRARKPTEVTKKD